MNAVFVKSSGIGESMYYGPGAGARPTATSIVADLMTIVNKMKKIIREQHTTPDVPEFKNVTLPQ